MRRGGGGRARVHRKDSTAVLTPSSSVLSGLPRTPPHARSLLTGARSRESQLGLLGTPGRSSDSRLHRCPRQAEEAECSIPGGGRWHRGPALAALGRGADKPHRLLCFPNGGLLAQRRSQKWPMEAGCPSSSPFYPARAGGDAAHPAPQPRSEVPVSHPQMPPLVAGWSWGPRSGEPSYPLRGL